MDVFEGLIPSETLPLNFDSIDLSRLFPSQFSSCNSIGANQTWPYPSTHLQECEINYNLASSSVPSTSCIDDTQWDLLGYGSFQGGLIDNQSLNSLFNEPNNLHGLEGFSSIDPSMYMDDDILRLVYPLPEKHNTQLDPALNDATAISSQSCITNMFSGKGKASDSPSSDKNSLTDGFQMHSIKEETLEPKKGLFSELGLDQILSNRSGCSSSAKSSKEEQCSAPKRQKMDFSGDSIRNFTMNSSVGFWTDQSCSVESKTQPKRAEDSSKVAKKRAKPGESAKPRPKDRQMIQDRFKELREIIPNGPKLSIDSLLDHTIKHMVFMQGVAKYADKLKQVDELKAQRANENGGISGSAAWAVEVGGHNPIVVEELGNPLQMLIGMVCQEQGLFLEIADVIRSFDLTILKGVVEARDDKIWAHFIVEANRPVTRMEVLMSLLQLLQDASSNVSKTASDENKTSSLLNNYHTQPVMPLSLEMVKWVFSKRFLSSTESRQEVFLVLCENGEGIAGPRDSGDDGQSQVNGYD